MTVRLGTSSTCWKTVPMPRSRLCRGEPMLHRRAVDLDLAGIRLLHAGEHADQGRFAGAVFAQQDVDLAGMEIERDIVIGDARPESAW